MQGLKIVFPSGAGEQAVLLKPAAGFWDLRDGVVVHVKVKNAGGSTMTPSVQIASKGGPTDTVTGKPLTPGSTQEILVPFTAAIPAKAVPLQKSGFGTMLNGTKFTSDTAGPIKISAQHTSPATLVVESIICDAPPAVLPEWLGKRPPVQGDWVMTFNDDFNGPTIDQKKWNIYGVNYWDKRTHWSKDNLILGGGVVKQHFEKKTGFHNDDPSQKQTEYACGFLETYGKWVQRYGYFEARVKLPEAPGLWPTFWMMPDRGEQAGPQWKRQSTNDPGMELDIMEHLTRWGPYRYNIAHHWDGYGKDHKSNGTTCNYVQHDKDGFITVGLLWTPGSAIYYCNGREMVRFEDPRVCSVESSILIETTTGGWDNSDVDDSKLPVDYVIDYVRCWQRKDLASPVDGFKGSSAPTPATAPATVPTPAPAI